MKFFKRTGGQYISQVVVLAVVFGFAAGIVGQLVSDVYISPVQQQYIIEPSTDVTIVPELRRIKRFLGIEQDFEVNVSIEKIGPAIAGIYPTKIGSSVLSQIYLPNDLLATGFTLTSDGWLVSYDGFINAINIEDVTVVYGGRSFDVEELITDSVTGIIFIKISANNLPVVVLGDSDELVLGQLIVVLNDLGEVVVTNIKNNNYIQAESGNDYVLSSEEYGEVILLSDSLSTAYLGSPVTNLIGEVVGVISQTGANTQVVPINQFRSIVLDVLRNNFVKRSYLGVDYIDLARVKGINTNLSQNQSRGALVFSNPFRNSPAAQADIAKNDIILSLDGQPIDEVNGLTDLVQQYQPGDSVEFEVLRNGQNLILEVTLAILPE